MKITFILFYFKILIIDFRERKEEWERERERKTGRGEHRFVVPLIYSFTDWFLYVSWLGIKSAALAYLGWCSNQLSCLVPSQGKKVTFKHAKVLTCILLTYSILGQHLRNYSNHIMMVNQSIDLKMVRELEKIKIKKK